MTYWGVVFARGGSKGVPGKNLRKVGGIPLVGHSIQTGLATPEIKEFFCSTDSEEIADAARGFGASIPFMRPAELAGDESPEWDAWQHFAKYLMAAGARADDAIVSLPTTSPLRNVNDVRSAIALYESSSADAVVTTTEASRSPWFNMVTVDGEGHVQVLLGSESGGPARRQDTPDVFDLTTVAYVASLSHILSAPRLFGGVVAGLEIPKERAVDIDTELDLDIADYLYGKRWGGR
jgi:N-acylneuraminate cytidylyltransferase